MWTETEVLELVTGLTARDLAHWVEEGWVLPKRRNDQPVYREIDIARLRLICQLRNDLDMREDALPTVLSLIDQVYGLRCELRLLAEAIEAQSEDVRRLILQHVRAARQRREDGQET